MTPRILSGIVLAIVLGTFIILVSLRQSSDYITTWVSVTTSAPNSKAIPSPTPYPTLPPLPPPPTETLVPPGVPNPIARPIFSTDEAIMRTLALLTSNVVVEAAEARLASRETVGEWLASSTNRQDVPYWIVAVSTSHLTQGNTNLLPGGESLVKDADPVAGMFVVWEATDGAMVASGSLALGVGDGNVDRSDPDRVHDLAFDSVVALPNEGFVIEQATLVPDAATPTP